MSELIDRGDVLGVVSCFFKDNDIDGLADLEREINRLSAASPWHRVEEPPKEDGKYVAINVKTKWWYEASYENGNWKAVDLFGQRWVVIHPTHWMPIEPPREDAISKEDRVNESL